MKLARWLDRNEITQAELARRLGITQGRVSQILAGAAPSLDLAIKIEAVTTGKVLARELSVDPASVVTGKGNPMSAQSLLDSVEAAIAAVRNGELVVVVDDDDRENEGDLIAAASKITTEQMAFMVRHTSGIVCAPMTRGEARRLKLDPMVADNDAPHGTAFTISVDFKDGLTTGISARERCATVHALANANAGAGDFVRPGHIFPLVAKRGGVLMRSGHTEAAVDLARLAGLPPVGVISELVNDDGTVKRGEQVLNFAREHHLKIISVDALIAYRQARERLVERTGTFDVPTPIGTAQGIAYSTPFDPVQHLALVFGQVADKESVPVRLHREDLGDDVFGERRTLNAVYEAFGREGCGVLIYLREGTTGVPASRLFEDAAAEGSGSAMARVEAWRDIGLGAQILRDLDLRSIKLLTSSTRHYVGLTGFGIEIDETVRLPG
jgi:3,4-dihydroxy 2-butanone 4-phosphate synthase/GTP cyclohydrolase II